MVRFFLQALLLTLQTSYTSSYVEVPTVLPLVLQTLTFTKLPRAKLQEVWRLLLTRRVSHLLRALLKMLQT